MPTMGHTLYRVAGLAHGLGEVVITMPDIILAAFLNNTLPTIAEDVFDTNFAEVAQTMDPVINNGFDAFEQVMCSFNKECKPLSSYEAVGIIQVVLANVQEMPAPAGNTPQPHTQDSMMPSHAYPKNSLFGKLIQYFDWIESDFSAGTWGKLHHKCTDFVSRFFAIKWDKSYEGFCKNDGNGNGICDCSDGRDDDDDKYPPASHKCRLNFNSDCKCYEHYWQTHIFTHLTEEKALHVCDALANKTNGSSIV